MTERQQETVDINEAIGTIARESGLERAALVRLFSLPGFAAFVRGLDELGAGSGWVAVNFHEGGVRDVVLWPGVLGGKRVE